MSKPSSYQKLKTENRELYQHIRMLIRDPNGMETTIIRMQYEMLFGKEDAVMFSRSVIDSINDKRYIRYSGGITNFIQQWINQPAKIYTDKERFDLERYGPWYYQVINVQHEYVKENAMLPGQVFVEATELKTGQDIHIDITEEAIKYLGFQRYVAPKNEP